MKDSLVVEKGKVANKKVADILTRLSIEPVEIGLDLVAVYEKGEILTKDILFIDEKEYIAKLVQAHSDSMAIAMEIGYAVPDTLNFLLSKASTNAHAVALKAEIMTDETKEELLAKAGSQAAAVESKIDT
jgi:large subunit ribosomal protein L10